MPKGSDFGGIVGVGLDMEDFADLIGARDMDFEILRLLALGDLVDANEDREGSGKDPMALFTVSAKLLISDCFRA